MSNNNYNFDDISDESPTIIMGGNTYKLSYPTLEEIEKIQELKTEKEQTEAIYNYVKKTEDSQPEFRDVLRKQNLKVLVAFTKMIKEEFGVE